MIILPNKFNIVSENAKEGVFEIAGLYPGYGITVGNSVRRILLSSIEGAAITYFKVNDAPHEFTTLKGVYENVLEVMLNLKQLRFKLFSDGPKTLYLEASGEKEVTGYDIKKDAEVELMNPEVHIATLTDKKSSLSLEITLEKGIGYSQVEDRQKRVGKLPIGVIGVDALFSPVLNATFEVENMRVGDRTDYNLLRIKITTDGTVAPHDALYESLTTSNKLTGAILNLLPWGQPKTEENPVATKETKVVKEAKEVKEEEAVSSPEEIVAALKDKDPKDIKIDEMGLSTRAVKALNGNGFRTLSGVLKISSETLQGMNQIGEKVFAEIKERVESLGYSLKTKEK
ncbi:MAG TPA: DNA-directed RNA polymerase subunit alpha [Candidatus Paceibacterota bacterium]|nr:DNA-directed RNA polymerase subunit alpha [Candidatus Paceibacterota bacterium]